MFIIVAAYITSLVNNIPMNIYKFFDNPHSKIDYFKTIFGKFSGIKEEQFNDVCNYKIIKSMNTGFDIWNPHTNALRCILVGYFQYYPNMIPYEKEIRNLFISGLSEYRNNLLTKYNFDNTGFIHIRRGDYINKQDIHYLQPIQYYEKALEKIDSNINFFIVSDDIQWVKSEQFFNNERFTFFEGDELETLALMSLCTSCAICANSTFSWWGAFLGTYEKRNPVFVPKKWISLAKPENLRLIPEEWNIIDVP
jgi:hypothetical protein